VDGLRVHARVIDGPPDRLPAVFVHGLGVASRYFEPTLERLAGRRRGFAPDLPGFGLSAKPPAPATIHTLADALEAWLDAADLAQVALVGNSVGCQVVVEVGRRRNGRVVRAALVGPTTEPSARSVVRSLARWARNARHEPLSLLPILVADYARAGVRRPARMFLDALRDPIEAKLADVVFPTLVVRGEEDGIVSAGWAAEVARLLPNGRLVEIPGAPHTVNYSAPDKLVGVLEPFLAEAD
jgi:pimeloyl-ACP methyl ester carboxylesterase